MQSTKRVYEVRPRKDKRGFHLSSDALPFGRLWYGEPDTISNALGYAKFFSRSHDAVIRVYNAASNVIKTHEHAGEGAGHYCPLAAGLSPSLIASASLTYFPFLLLP
jgi:hypothetical protein